jgi:flagellar biosynthesis chaperone FliJ
MSAKARKLFNPWNIALVTLLVGLMLGYQVNDVLSSRKIDDLQEAIDGQSATISALEQQVAVLHENYTRVQDDLEQVTEVYETLQNHAVLRTVYDELLEDYEDATHELDDANDMVSELEDEVSDLGYQVSELEEEYDELQESYFKLWNEYNKIRVLSWTYFVIDGLEVNLTTTKLEYELNSNIEGVVMIHHVGGEPFNGTFELRSWSEYLNIGTSSAEKQIYGETEYTFVNPFKFGAGSYSLRVSSIKDAEGNVIASSNQLKDYSIDIQVG